MKRLTIAAAAMACAAASWATAPKLEIYSGNADTTYAATQTIVAVTDPGATAMIGGAPAKVYATGSFGAKVDLAPGQNKVRVATYAHGDSTVKTLDIFRSEQPKPEAPKKEGPKEMTYADDICVETLAGAYLQYGNGDDRLGGSKMGFLPEGILLRATGECGDLYRVQLSANRWAYLPMEHAKKADMPLPTAVNTGSWSISNQGKADRVAISLPRRLPYRTYTLLEPSTIVVELYGAMDNSNWMTQRSMDLGMVDYVTFNQKESDVYEMVIRLKHDYQWGYSVRYEGASLIVDVRHKPADLRLKALTIGLDAGHGGPYPGAYSPSGLKEKDVNLDIILRLRDLLEKEGATVVLTREGDTGPSMAERKKIWLEGNVDLAISVHNNSGGGALSSPGTSTFYKHLFDRPLAEAVLTRLLETGLPMFGLVGNFNFSLNGPTEYPNVLVEGAFMSSLEEEEKLADPAFRQLMAEKILQGLKDYLKAAK